MALTHDADRAADLVQDAAEGVSRRGGPWSLPYVLRAIRNRHIDLHRRKGLSLVALDVRHPQPSQEPDLPTGAADPRLERALAALDTDDRELLYLSAVEGWTAAEIADLTRRPRGTVLSRMARAKARMRASLEKEGQPNGRSAKEEGT